MNNNNNIIILLLNCLFLVVYGNNINNNIICKGSIKDRHEIPYKYVDPFIGSGGDGYNIGALNPGVLTPFGMIRAGPDTALNKEGFVVKFRNFGGYSFCDSFIRAFSQTHTVGAGATDYGNIGIMPVNEVNSNTITCWNATNNAIRTCGWLTEFNHSADGEDAQLGFYFVKLLSSTGIIDVNITATRNVAMYQFNWYNNSNDHSIIIDPCHMMSFNTKRCQNMSISIINDTIIEGMIHEFGDFSDRFGGFTIYFAIKLNIAFSSYGIYSNNHIYKDETSTHTPFSGIYVNFEGTQTIVEMSVSISFQSTSLAYHHLVTQIGANNFQTISVQNRHIWDDILNIIQVEGDNINDKIKFYTALYHSFSAPTTFDENNEYIGLDKKIHRLDTAQQHYYTDLSIWDIFRTEFPLLILLQPSIAQDILISIYQMATQVNRFPKWPLATGETNSMIGMHSLVMMADGLLAGLNATGSYHLNDLIQLAAQSLRNEEKGSGYLKYGYVTNKVSNTLAFTLDDFCVASLGKLIGDEQMYNEFLTTSKQYINLWNTQQQFFCPKDDQQEWIDSCNNTKQWSLISLDVWDSHYTEGDAWHYRFYPMHNLSALTELFGNKSRMIDQLEAFFANSKLDPLGNFLPNPFYWAGNEEDLHALFAFLYADRPDLVQYWLPYIMNTSYSIQTNGIPGNDDYGTMSAWYIFSALGFYPIEYCGGRYGIGAPLFNKVTIQRSPKQSIIIEAHNISKENIFVSKVLINKKPLTEPFFDVTLLTMSKEDVIYIDFYMINQPNIFYNK